MTIHEGDVGRLMRVAGPGRFDGILLDVDNGPGGLTRAGNDAPYDARGLAAARDQARGLGGDAGRVRARRFTDEGR